MSLNVCVNGHDSRNFCQGANRSNLLARSIAFTFYAADFNRQEHHQLTTRYHSEPSTPIHPSPTHSLAVFDTDI